jgi:hypothetical protein
MARPGFLVSMAMEPWCRARQVDSKTEQLHEDGYTVSPKAADGHSRWNCIDGVSQKTHLVVAMALPGSVRYLEMLNFLPDNCASLAGMDAAVCSRFSCALAEGAVGRLRPLPLVASHCVYDVRGLRHMVRASSHSCQNGNPQWVTSALDCVRGFASCAMVRLGMLDLDMSRASTKIGGN